jgi:membrane-associated phospholipid phosphatase
MRPEQNTTTAAVRPRAAPFAAPLLLLLPFTLIAVLMAGDWAPLHDLDRAVTDRLNEVALAHPGWVSALSWWSLIFHPTTWRVAAAGLVAWLWWRRRDRRAAAFVTVAMTIGALLGVLLKVLFGRHRPVLLDPVAEVAGFAFPSGHALTNALGATVFLLVLLPLVGERPLPRAVLWTAAVVIPLVTAFTRVGLGVHWTSDVVAGLLFGVALALATHAVVQRWGGNSDERGAGRR